MLRKYEFLELKKDIKKGYNYIGYQSNKDNEIIDYTIYDHLVFFNYRSEYGLQSFKMSKYDVVNFTFQEFKREFNECLYYNPPVAM